MQAPFAVPFLLAWLCVTAEAERCPPPSSSMLRVVREANQVRLVRLAGRERVQDPFARDTTFLGYRALGGAELRAPAAKRLAAAFGKSSSYGCGEAKSDTIFSGLLQIGLDFVASAGRLRLVLLEPERTVQLHLDTGAYTESKLSDQGLKGWHAALDEILRERGETLTDFERRLGATAPAAKAVSAPPSGVTGEPVELEGPDALEATLKVGYQYPDLAREAGVDGTVMLRVLVGTDSLVHEAKVIRSIPMLDRAAIDAVKQWRFKPLVQDGKTRAAWIRVPVKFSLHGP